MPLLPRLLSFFRRKAYSSVPMTGNGGWYPIIREPFTGAWQRNISLDARTALTFHADFACKTLIASDIAKLPVRLVEQDADGVWIETTSTAFSPVLRKPNRYQTRNQFWESWILSKLYRGNTYVLKEFDNRRVVAALHVLNPDRVQVLEADDGSVFYRLSTDRLNGVTDDIVVPATAIIHDRFNCLFHPLVGIPPIFASCLAAMQGLNIQNYSAALFANASQPGGILTAPNKISPETADRLKKEWEEGHAGRNVGRLAVLGDGLKYEKLSLTAVEGQLIEQLKWSAEVVCSTYHVPPYKIGVGQPLNNNVQALNDEYYKQCLQALIEAAEACLDDGLGLGEQYRLGVEFDINNLLRLDFAAQMDALEKGRNYITPNEGRKWLNLPKTKGGDVVLRQQQDYSLEALAKRDAKADPFGTAKPPAPEPKMPTEPPDDMGDEMDDDDAKSLAAWRLEKSLDAAPDGGVIR